MRLRRAGAALAAGLLLMAGLWRALPGWSAFPRSAAGLLEMSHVEIGEGLLHGAHPPHVDVSWRMPLNPLLEALLLGHAGPGGAAAVAAAGLAACATLLLWSGLLVAGPVGGAAALGLWLPVVAGHAFTPGYLKMFLFTPLVLLAAGSVAWRARAPTPGRAAVVAVILGGSLLYRSTLAFFPIALVAWECLRSGRRGPWREWLILLIVPVLFVIPWAAMNWSVHREVTFFERGSANMNIVTGALGLVDVTAEGDIRSLMDAAPADGRSSVLGWAVRHVAAHPRPFLSAVLSRLSFFAGLKPFLLLAAGLTLVLMRRRAAFQQLGLFAAYFILVNCLMSAGPYHFEPLWPVLCLLAGALPAALASEREPAADAPFHSVLPSLGAVMLLSAGLAVSWLLLRYASLTRARPAASPAAFEAALAGSPDDPLLLYERARLRAGQGRLAAALDDLDRVDPAWPDLPRMRLLRAWIGSLQGRPGALRDGAFPGSASSPFNDDVSRDAAVYRALASVRRGDLAGAGRHLDAAAALWQARQGLSRPPLPEERVFDERLRSDSDATFIHEIERVLSGQDAAAAALELSAAAPKGRPRLMEGLGLFLQERGRDREALEVFRRFTGRRPDLPQAWVARGVSAYRNGLRAEALKSLRTAVRLDPSSPAAVVSLSALHAEAGRWEQAVSVHEEALRAGPAGADLALLRASREQAVAGLRAAAQSRRR